MAESEKIPGIDTIRGLVGSPPLVNVISYKAMKDGTMLQQVWNAANIAFIPYCFKCKAVLDWHTPPDNGKVFSCPNCGRQWVLGGKDGQ